MNIKNARRVGLIVFLYVISPVIIGCKTDDITIEDTHIDYSDLEVVMNSSVSALQELVVQAQRDGRIDRVESEAGMVWKVYFVNLNLPLILSNVCDSNLPNLTIEPEGGAFYWYLGDEFLCDVSGKKIRVDDEDKKPSFKLYDGKWWCVTDHSQLVANSQLSNTSYQINVTNDNLVIVTMPSSYVMTFPTKDFVLPFVPQQAFYKDIFLDAGVGLTSRKVLYAAKYLNLSLEGISFPRSSATAEDIALQNSIIAGEESDINGRLLYPDGQPRFRVLFVNGGSSREHGVSLNVTALENMRMFVRNGGSYVGTCAGAFFASSGYDAVHNYPYYLALWPSTQNHTGIVGGATGMFIEDNSPLLQYYDFGGDHYVSDVRHNKGGYPVNLPAYTEVLARYDCPQNSSVHQQPSVWAYKTNETMGRIVMEGSHPEEVSSGERRDLTAAIILYAMDGQGATPLKGVLQNRSLRIMNLGGEDAAPSHAKIGDMQCHHFAVYIPENAVNINVRVDSDINGELSVSMKYGSFAYSSVADYTSADNSAHPRLSFNELESGLWYVAVQCHSRVSVRETDYGQDYSSPIDVLNGIPYQVIVSWEGQIETEKPVDMSRKKVQ